MDLTLQLPGDHYYIRSIGEQGIRVFEQWYSGALLIRGDSLDSELPSRRIEDLDQALLQRITESGPEVVLIGTGARQQFLPPDLMMPFYRAGIGIEIMTTQAACHTFNILVAEGRDVTALLLPIEN